MATRKTKIQKAIKSCTRQVGAAGSSPSDYFRRVRVCITKKMRKGRR